MSVERTNDNDTVTMQPQDLLGNFLGGENETRQRHQEAMAADAGSIPKFSNEDAGQKARKKVQARAGSVRTALLRTYLLITGIFFLLVAGAAWYLYTHIKTPGVMVTDTRPCEYVDEERGIRLTGRRHYSYMERELFGIQYKDSSKVMEETELDVKGSSMNVVGLSTDSWWGLHIGQGEQGIQLLKPATVLVFTLGQKNVVVNDRDFCK